MCFLLSFFKNQHGRLVFPAGCSPHPLSLGAREGAQPAEPRAAAGVLRGAAGPHSPVDPVPGGEALPVALHEVGVLLRAVERAAVAEQPVQGRLAGGGRMLLGERRGGRGRDRQHPAREAQRQQGCPRGRRRPEPPKPSATLPPHASPGRLVSSFSRHALRLRAAPPGLLALEKSNTERSVQPPVSAPRPVRGGPAGRPVLESP